MFESYNYDAYGNVTIKNSGGSVISTSAYGNRFLFQGREYDYATQLYHFRARWYDTETGRWLSNDPIGISGGLNLYAFCANDPVNFVDPMGLDVFFNRVPILGGHAWVKVGGESPRGEEDGGITYGAYPCGYFLFYTTMLIQTPDDYANSYGFRSRFYKTTKEDEEKLSEWICSSYDINGTNNFPYSIPSNTCWTFSSEVEEQLIKIIKARGGQITEYLTYVEHPDSLLYFITVIPPKMI